MTAPGCRAREPGILTLVAARRASKLLLVAVGAMALAGCSAGQAVPPTTTHVAHGTIRGILLWQPGDPFVLSRPMAGTIYIEFKVNDALEAIIVPVGKNGTFSRSVTPGTYKVLPTSHTGCISGPITVDVLAGKIDTVKVICGSK